MDAIGKLLRQNAGKGDIGGVGLDDAFQGGVEMAEKRLFQENGTNRLEGVLLIGTPFELGVGLQESGQWSGCFCEIREETAIKIHKTQKRLDVANFLRDRPFDKGLDFFFAHLEAIAADAETKKVNGGLMELAFFRRCVELPFAKDGKDFSDMLGMFCDAAAVDQDIVKVNDHEMVNVMKPSLYDPDIGYTKIVRIPPSTFRFPPSHFALCSSPLLFRSELSCSVHQ